MERRDEQSKKHSLGREVIERGIKTEGNFEQEEKQLFPNDLILSYSWIERRDEQQKRHAFVREGDFWKCAKEIPRKEKNLVQQNSEKIQIFNLRRD